MRPVGRYKAEMKKHLPEGDDRRLLEYHRRAIERLVGNVVVDEAAINEAFMEIIELNWKKCEDLCRKMLERLESRILSDEDENQRLTLKRLRDEYNAEIGGFLRSLMEFKRLEYLNARQRADFDTLLKKEKSHKTESGDGEEHFEKELELRMTWGRFIAFWQHWVEYRKETIDIFKKILDIFRGEEGESIRMNHLQALMVMDEFDDFRLQFVHIVNKDLFCYKLLLTKLTEFRDLLKSEEYLDAFAVEAKDLFFNVTTCQNSMYSVLYTRHSETHDAFEMFENVINREQEEDGETAKLLACTSRPLLHLRDLLRELDNDDRLNQAGIESLITSIKQEETDMSMLVSASRLSLMEVYGKVNDAAEKLQTTIKEWLPKREETIAKLKEIIEMLNKTTKDVAITQTVSSSVGIIGGATIIAGLISAPFTMGVSLIPTAIAGGVLSGVGAVTAIGAAVTELVIDKKEMENAMNSMEADKVLTAEVAQGIENYNLNRDMLLRYMPEDELEYLLLAMIDQQSLPTASTPQVVQNLSINIGKLASTVGKTTVIPFFNVAMRGALPSLTLALRAVGYSFAAIGVAFDVANLVLASVKLGKGAKSDNAQKLEEVVKNLEDARDIIANCFVKRELV